MEFFQVNIIVGIVGSDKCNVCETVIYDIQ